MEIYKPIKIILIFLSPTIIFASQSEVSISGGLKVLKVIAQFFHDGMNIVNLGQSLTNGDSSTWYILIGVAIVWGLFNLFLEIKKSKTTLPHKHQYK